MKAATCGCICVYIVLVLASSSNGQQPVGLGAESQLNSMPWYQAPADGQPARLKDLSNSDPGRSSALDRFDIPERVEGPQKAQPNQPPPPVNGNGNVSNFNFRWLSGAVWVFLILLLVGFAAFLVWVYLKSARSERPRPAAADADQIDLRDRIKQLPFQMERREKIGDFRQQAAAAASNGDFGRATMLLFSYVLISLDKLGLIELQKSKTNRQYVAELSDHVSIIRYFERVMNPFEDHFFGNHSIEEQRFTSCWKELDRFLKDANEIAQRESVT